MKNIKKYNFTINNTPYEAVFSPDSMARYTLNGKRVPGVTTILGMINKPELMPWVARMAARSAFLSSSLAGVNPDLVKELTQPGKFSGARAKEIAAKYSEFSAALTAHTDSSDDAKDVGTNCHKYLEDYVEFRMGNANKPEMPSDVKHIMQPVIDWLEGKFSVTPLEKRTKFNKNIIEIAPNSFSDIKFLGSEKSVFSVKYWYAGTFDLVAEINGEKYILDLKTSAGIYGREYFYQMAAYRQGCEENGLYNDIAGSIIIRSGKDGDDLEVRLSKAYDADLKGFLAALTLYKDGFVDFNIPVNNSVADNAPY